MRLYGMNGYLLINLILWMAIAYEWTITEFDKFIVLGMIIFNVIIIAIDGIKKSKQSSSTLESEK